MRYAKTPPIAQVAKLCAAIKRDTDFNDPDLVDPYDDFGEGVIEITIGADPDGGWSYQTGDNSFTGGAYGFPYWGTGYILADTNCRDLARDLVDQIKDGMAGAGLNVRY